jgi:2-oxoglutarate dehydrogenase E1 component
MPNDQTDLERFYGPNAGYVLDLYERYQKDPSYVDEATRAAFAHWTPMDTPAPPTPSKVSPPVGADFDKLVAATRVARRVRWLGHLTSDLDPLGTQPPGDPGLLLETHGLTTKDLKSMPASVIGGPCAVGAANALEALGNLRRVYSGAIGYEDEHVQVADERQWLRDAAESRRFFQGFGTQEKRSVLKRLTEVEAFEQFIHRTYVNQKRFSIEGTDALVPMLDQIIHDAAQAGTHEVVMGMAHRGRLNVLAHILGKPYSAILAEFESAKQNTGASVAGTGNQGWTGDVKYHLGAQRTYTEDGTRGMPITLAPNPSHLEFVDPVVEGRARAAQDLRHQPGKIVRDSSRSLAIQIHGDAAFPGQGIVAETLNLSQLRGYSVGGSIHIITNNQVGFTTDPRDSRSTLSASDLAKGFEIPIVHVNADVPEACIAAARMAWAYREKFGKDFLIDLIGYRRYGHNEGEEPSFTQPRMYEMIAQHPTARAIFAKQLENEHVISRDEAEGMLKAVLDKLQAARQSPSAAKPTSPAEPQTRPARKATQLSAEALTELNEALLVRPEGFTANAKLEERILKRRRTGLAEPGGISWGHAEALAFASILADGTPIRLTGQDSERATFGSRHAVLHDPVTGARLSPFQELPQAKAAFAVYNSPLSESAVLGFEYGYSIHATETLVLWEAQFGDFANGAQVIIDQFIVSGNAKWQQTPSLVLLLPHGYEGQGPEHSSARLERYLQLAAGDNVSIVNCTTAAQFFHVLRRQAARLETNPCPLIVMTPKSLLNHAKAASSLSDLTEGTFQPILDDAEARKHAKKVTRLVLCSGKVYVDFITSKYYLRDGTPDPRLAVARIEELYPFPERVLSKLIASYPNLRELVWMQEEPRNMGAWWYVRSRILDLVSAELPLLYAGRAEAASPAEGSARRHSVEQGRLMTAAANVSESRPDHSDAAPQAAPAALPEPELEVTMKRSEVHAR